MNNRILRSLAPLGLPLLVSASLYGQLADSRFGLAGSLVVPTGDTAEIASMGFGVGAFWEMPFTDRLNGRTTIDYSSFSNKTGKQGNSIYKAVDFSQMGLMCDATFDLNDQRFYLLGGLGWYSSKWSGEKESFSASNVCVNLGGGWHFMENFDLEAKYVVGGDWPRMQVSLLWRFQMP